MLLLFFGCNDIPAGKVEPGQVLPVVCDVLETESEGISIDSDCTSPLYDIQDPWSVVVEWQWSGLPGAPTIDQVMVAPMIANLTDDDGDGTISLGDTPDIVVVVFDSRDGLSGDSGGDVDGRLIALDGVTGAVHWELSNAYWKGGPAIGDLDGDGWPEVIAVDEERRPFAVSGATGQPIWSCSTAIFNRYPHISLADLDMDGSPEVIADNLVINGQDGSVKFALSVPADDFQGRMPTVADINLDGRQEIIIASRVFDADGNQLWSTSRQGYFGHWTAVLNADSDPEAEVLMVSDFYMDVYNHDGSVIYETETGDGKQSPPCVGDLDGDGNAEIAFAASNLLRAYELNGSLKWSSSVTDLTGLAACSVYDIDGDGAYEVLYADENTFFVFDGSGGSKRFSLRGHASGTIFEYPTIADVDNDGSAEIIISSNNFRVNGEGWAGVTVFGHSGDGWAKSGQAWALHEFANTNSVGNAEIPRIPEPSWLTNNLYRGRPTEDSLAVDLSVEVVDICFSGCTDLDQINLSIRVRNNGPYPVQQPIPVKLQGVGDGFSSVLAELSFEPLSEGEQSPSQIVAVSVADYVGLEELLIVVDEEERIRECNEDNNSFVLQAEECSER